MLNINIAGEWDYFLQDSNKNELCFVDCFESQGKVSIPNTISTARLSPKHEYTNNLTKSNVQSLRDPYKFVGSLWLRKLIDIPKITDSRQVKLYIERVNYTSTVWVDKKYLGTVSSCSVGHEFVIDRELVSGKCIEIIIKIDNIDSMKLGDWSSAFTDETQTKWLGLVGKIELQLSKPKIKLNYDEHSENVSIQFVLEGGVYDAVEVECKELSLSGVLNKKDSGYTNTFDICKSQIKMWDAIEPHLYRAFIHGVVGNERTLIDELSFGVRDISVKNQQFAVNDSVTFLRGTLDCGVFPETGHPPMNKTAWLKIFRIQKDFGLNHVRFHSWCPPEVAFEAADEIGMYLQVEGPFWLDHWMKYNLGGAQCHRHFIIDETMKIVQSYHHHPSFCFFAVGNEMGGNGGELSILDDAVKQVKETFPMIKYSLSCNTLIDGLERPLSSNDDFFVSKTINNIGVRGQYYLEELVSGKSLNFNDATQNSTCPVVTHEVGQYLVYPNMEEISKYQGVLKPINFLAIEEDLKKKGLLHKSRQYLKGSGHLSKLLYKAEIESALKTSKLAGIQLLGLQDYPGQYTATIGMLDSFWENKGVTTAREFQGFCGDVTLLIDYKKNVYFSDEEAKFWPVIANYSKDALNTNDFSFEVYDGDVLVTCLPLEGHIANAGCVTDLRELTFVLEEHISDSNTRLIKFVFHSNDGKFSNSWDVMFVSSRYRGMSCDKLAEGYSSVSVTRFASDIERHNTSKKVLVVPHFNDLFDAIPGKLFPVFWSPVWYETQSSLGLLINQQSSMLEKFPTGKYLDLHWKDIVENSASFSYEGLKRDIEPIIDVIPNYFFNTRRSCLLEFQVLGRHVVVSSIDFFGELNENPVAIALLDSVLNGLSSSCSDGLNEISIDEFYNIVSKDSKQSATEVKNWVTNASDYYDKTTSHSKVIDGNDITYWEAPDLSPQHYWEVDFGSTKKVDVLKIRFAFEGHFEFKVLYTEGSEYDMETRVFVQDSKDFESIVDFTARKLRVQFVEIPIFAKASISSIVIQ